MLTQPAHEQTTTHRLRLEFGEPGFAPRDLVVEPGGVRFGPASGDSAGLVLRCHPEVPVLLAMGRLDVPGAVTTYGMTMQGDEALAGLLRSRFGAF